MKFLITGGTGLIGTRLSQLLINNGHSVNILTRKIKNQDNSSLKYFVWNTSKKTVDNRCIDDVDVIINLAGSSVFSLWTKSKKKNDFRFKERCSINNLWIDAKKEE